MRVLLDHHAPVRSLAYSPDGRWLVSGCQKGEVRLWDLSEEKKSTRIFRHPDWVRDLDFAPDQSCLYSTGWVNSYCVTNLTRSFPSAHHPTDSIVWSIASSKDGWQQAVGLGLGMILLKSKTRQLITADKVSHKSPVVSMSFSPNNQLLASASHDNHIKVWDAHWGHLLTELTQPKVFGGTRGVAFSSNGRYLASGGGVKGQALIWSTEDFSLHRTVGHHQDCITSVRFHPQNRYLLTASWDGTVGVHDIETGELCTSYDWNLGRLYCMAISPDGMTAAVGGRSREIVIWDLEEAW